jgi:hypothetical protein
MKHYLKPGDIVMALCGLELTEDGELVVVQLHDDPEYYTEQGPMIVHTDKDGYYWTDDE